MSHEIDMSGESKHIEINLAKIKKEGVVYEVNIDPDMAMEFKSGKAIDIRDIVKSPLIFNDAQKGLRAAENLLVKHFGTSDGYKVAEIIIKEGEVQLSTNFRRELREKKKRQIIALIHRSSINPQNNLPHPEARIESAMEEARVKIDEFKKAEDQIQVILKDLMKILPIRYEVRTIEVIIDAKFAPQSYHILKNFGTIADQTWLNDGSLMAKVKIPAGMQSDFFDKLNNLTHGTVKTRIIENR
jgi:ribosome maturation protein SDO1